MSLVFVSCMSVTLCSVRVSGFILCMFLFYFMSVVCCFVHVCSLFLLLACRCFFVSCVYRVAVSCMSLFVLLCVSLCVLSCISVIFCFVRVSVCCFLVCVFFKITCMSLFVVSSMPAWKITVRYIRHKARLTIKVFYTLSQMKDDGDINEMMNE